jgi:hypothetical protein
MGAKRGQAVRRKALMQHALPQSDESQDSALVLRAASILYGRTGARGPLGLHLDLVRSGRSCYRIAKVGLDSTMIRMGVHVLLPHRCPRECICPRGG